MDSIRARLDGIAATHRAAITRTEDVVLMSFHGGRTQRIKVTREADRYVLTSVVARRALLVDIPPDRLGAMMWTRNDATDVVALALDARGRMVGRVEALAETLDDDALVFYLSRVGAECDRMEYILSGRDDE